MIGHIVHNMNDSSLGTNRAVGRASQGGPPLPLLAAISLVLLSVVEEPANIGAAVGGAVAGALLGLALPLFTRKSAY